MAKTSFNTVNGKCYCNAELGIGGTSVIVEFQYRKR